MDPTTTLETISAWWQGSELRRQRRQDLDICMNWARRLKRVFGIETERARAAAFVVLIAIAASVGPALRAAPVDPNVLL